MVSITMKATNEVRVQVRTTKDEKAFLEKAARRCGFKTLSEFIRVSAYEKARADLKEYPESSFQDYQTPTEPTKLSRVDSMVFVDSILNEKEPNLLLKSLFSKNNEEILEALQPKKQKRES